MTTPPFPGTTFVENLASPAAAVGEAVSSPCFVGAHPRGPVVPTLINSWADWVTNFGDFDVTVTPSDLQMAVFLCLAQGGAPLYAMRVASGTEVVAAVDLLDREPTVTGDDPTSPQPTLTVTALNPGAWGNLIAVSWQDTSVDTDATPRGTFGVWFNGVLVERYTSVSYDPVDQRYLINVVNAKSNYVTLTDTRVANTIALATPAQTGTTTDDVFTVEPASLTAGADAGSAPATAKYTAAFPLLDAVVAPLDLNVPNIATAAIIDAALAYAEGRGDTFVVIDSTAGDGSDDVTGRAATYQGLNGATSFGAVYWPQIVVPDPSKPASSDATLQCAAGGAVVGQYALNDTNNGPQKAPAGYGTNLLGVIGLEVNPSSVDLTVCQNSVPAVNPLRAIPGAGIVIMGARTLQTNGRVDRFVNARRALIYIETNLALQTNFALFSNNDSSTWAAITAACSDWLTGFWGGGGLAGDTSDEAYFVTCDSTTNTENTIENGETITQVGVALLTPAEFLIFQISQLSGLTSTTETS